MSDGPAADGRFESAMRTALSEARRAVDTDDVPVGALILDSDGEMVASARNRREADADPTGHAELLAIRAAAARLGRWRLDDCTLVVTLEPCTMCAGAIVLSRLDRLVFDILGAPCFDERNPASSGLVVLPLPPIRERQRPQRVGAHLGRPAAGFLRPQCDSALKRANRPSRIPGDWRV